MAMLNKQRVYSKSSVKELINNWSMYIHRAMGTSWLNFASGLPNPHLILAWVIDVQSSIP
jgi:hypothetical protein